MSAPPRASDHDPDLLVRVVAFHVERWTPMFHVERPGMDGDRI